MSEYYCPVQGCDFGDTDGKSFQSVRSHITGTADDDHDWSDLQAAVERQGDDPDGPTDDPPAEGDDDPADPPEEGADDGGDSPDDEVTKQWTAVDASDEGGDDPPESGDGDGDGGPTADGGQGGLSLPVSTPVLVGGLVGLALLVLVVQYRSGGTDADTPADQGGTEASDPVDAPAEDPTDQPTEPGADGEAGPLTGGVVDE